MSDLDLFDYHLPESRIAQEPLSDRAASKLLWLHRDTGEVEHLAFRDVTRILQRGDLLVMNDTRVTALRLFGKKSTGAAIELLLLREIAPGTFEVLAKPGRRLMPGARLEMDEGLRAEVVEHIGAGRKLIRFDDDTELQHKLSAAGKVPLPPYITKDLSDKERYQTVYAKVGGSAAAPTAGLHFTPEILQELSGRGVQTATVTLNVGLDTFRPISSGNLDEHVMHGETCSVSAETARAVGACKGRVVAVGTTSTRTLETFAVGPRELRAGETESRLFIRPGYQFQVVDGMFTNFHMPRTTMLVMLSALAGRDNVMKAYEEALQNDYRFLSFGDSMLIL